MSTRAIREALHVLESEHGRDIEDAMRETEAIERAAKVVGAWPAVVLVEGSSLDENAKAHALMVAIAKDAP